MSDHPHVKAISVKRFWLRVVVEGQPGICQPGGAWSRGARHLWSRETLPLIWAKGHFQMKKLRLGPKSHTRDLSGLIQTGAYFQPLSTECLHMQDKGAGG